MRPNSSFLEKSILNCTDIEDVLGDYVDGDLTPTIKNRVEEHIAGCDECLELFYSYLLTIRLAKELKPMVSMQNDNAIQNKLRGALNERLGLNLPVIKD